MTKNHIGALMLFCFIGACTTERAQKTGQQTYIKAIYSLPLTLNPIQMNDTSSLLVSNLIYDGLLSFTPELQFKGAIAESWSPESNGRSYVFKIRSNAKFHDGTPITPTDVVKSLSRALSKESIIYKYYDCILGADEYHQGKASSVEGLKVEGRDKVRIDLKYPFPPFLSVLAGATAKILPSGADTDPNFYKHPIGSGAFLYKETKQDKDELILSRFENYYDSKPKIETMILRALSEVKAQEQATQGKVDDLANYPLAGNEAVFKSGVDVDSPLAATWIIGFNARIAPFNDSSVRKAFKTAVDTDGFRAMFYPDALKAFGYIPKGLSGYTNSSTDTSAVKKPKNVKHIEVAFPSVLARQEEMRTYLENGLKKQGWDVSFVPMSWDKLMEGYSKKTLQAFLVSMNMDYPDTEFLIRNFESNNPDNFSGVKNEKLDSLIRKARSTQDRVERETIYQNIVAEIENQAVTVNLFHPKSHNWVSRCVKNFTPNMLADYYIDYKAVELDSDCVKAGRDHT